MKRIFLAAVVVLGLNGCCAFCTHTADKEFILEVRKHLIENVRPNYAEALQTATKEVDQENEAGETITITKPRYIKPYKQEQLGVVDAMIESADRIYPPEKPTELPPTPWADEE